MNIKHTLTQVVMQGMKVIRAGPFKKFVVVGGIGFVINTVMLELFVQMFGFSPAFSSAIGAEFAIISNFFLNNAWTFKERKIEQRKTFYKLLQFNTTSLGAIAIQAGSVWLGTHIFGEPWYRLFYIIGVGIGLVWNYIMYSKVIWKK